MLFAVLLRQLAPCNKSLPVKGHQVVCRNLVTAYLNHATAVQADAH